MLFFEICSVFLLLTLPLFLSSLPSLNRWWRLSGVLLYWFAAWGAAEGFLALEQLTLNWQEGYDSMRKLDSFIAALNSGEPLPVVRYNLLWGRLRFAFIFCVAGVCWNITAALLAVNPYKKNSWIVFLIAPLWFGGSLLWNMETERIQNGRVWRTVQFAHLQSEIEADRAKGIPDSLIAGNLEESRNSFRFGYENNRAGRESVRRVLESLKKLPDRVEIQKAMEVLKRVNCICEPVEDKAAEEFSPSAAFRILYCDAVRNGMEGVVRLFHTARTNEGRIYAMAILYRLDPNMFRSETASVMRGEVRFRQGGKDWTERAEEIRRHPERLEKSPFSKLFSSEKTTD